MGQRAVYSQLADYCRQRSGNVTKDGITIGTVGRLSVEKNYPLLVRAFALMQNKLGTSDPSRSTPHVQLLFVGDGEERERIEQEVTKVTERRERFDIEFVGMQSNVYEWLQKMDIFCLSSITEGTSMTLLEAGAARLPCVVTDVGGNSEIVADGETGIVVPAGDEEAFAEALFKLVENKELRVRFGRAARKRVCERYSVKSMVGAYVSVYEELGAKSKERRGGDF